MRIVIPMALVAAGALASLIIACQPTQAETSPQNPPPCNKDPCIINYDGGGIIDAYHDLADRIVATGWKVIINGECYSSCTVLADRARPNVCITHKARLFIHQSTLMGPMPGGKPMPWEGDPDPAAYRKPIDYSEDLTSWINYNGGQPLSGWLYMPFEEALNFWPLCGAAP